MTIHLTWQATLALILSHTLAWLITSPLKGKAPMSVFNLTPIAGALFSIVGAFGGAESLVKDACNLIGNLPSLSAAERKALQDPAVQDAGIALAKAGVAFAELVAADMAPVVSAA